MIFEDFPAVVDFKTTSRMRDRESIERYFLQCTFYALAWGELTGEKIEKIIVVMVSEDGKMEIFRENTSTHVPKLIEIIKKYKNAL